MTPLLAQRLRTDRSFERMYRRYVADVYHYALAVCRDANDAEDVTQTTFLNAYRAVQAGKNPRAPKNWLIAIAHNVCRQRFRQAARRPSEVELEDGIAIVVPDDDGPGAEDIRRALGELAFNQRSALVMRELEGRSYSEIAEILGTSVSAVETLIFRARRALREQLEGSLTCGEAELALSKQLDGRLSRAEKGALRAHLRSCKECARFARSQRAQRSTLKGLAAVPLPSSLSALFGGGGAAVGSALATKAAAVTALGLLVTGAGVETARNHPWRSDGTGQRHAVAKTQPAAAAPTAATAPGAVREESPPARVRKPLAAKAQRAAEHPGAAHARPAAAQERPVTSGHGNAAQGPQRAKSVHPARPVHRAQPSPAKQKAKKQHAHGPGPTAGSEHGKPAVKPAGRSGHGKGGPGGRRGGKSAVQQPQAVLP